MADGRENAEGSSQSPPMNKRNSIADRTAAVTVKDGSADLPGPSKNAKKRAEKQEKLAADKANKSANKPAKEVGKSEAKKGANKGPKKPVEGSVLIGINASKEDDFSAWYQQVLTKGDMLDYYDVSGCYILKVGCPTGG